MSFLLVCAMRIDLGVSAPPPAAARRVPPPDNSPHVTGRAHVRLSFGAVCLVPLVSCGKYPTHCHLMCHSSTHRSFQVVARQATLEEKQARENVTATVKKRPVVASAAPAQSADASGRGLIAAAKAALASSKYEDLTEDEKQQRAKEQKAASAEAAVMIAQATKEEEEKRLELAALEKERQQELEEEAAAAATEDPSGSEAEARNAQDRTLHQVAEALEVSAKTGTGREGAVSEESGHAGGVVDGAAVSKTSSDDTSGTSVFAKAARAAMDVVSGVMSSAVPGVEKEGVAKEEEGVAPGAVAASSSTVTLGSADSAGSTDLTEKAGSTDPAEAATAAGSVASDSAAATSRPSSGASATMDSAPGKADLSTTVTDGSVSSAADGSDGSSSRRVPSTTGWGEDGEKTGPGSIKDRLAMFSGESKPPAAPGGVVGKLGSRGSRSPPFSRGGSASSIQKSGSGSSLQRGGSGSSHGTESGKGRNAEDASGRRSPPSYGKAATAAAAAGAVDASPPPSRSGSVNSMRSGGSGSMRSPPPGSRAGGSVTGSTPSPLKRANSARRQEAIAALAAVEAEAAREEQEWTKKMKAVEEERRKAREERIKVAAKKAKVAKRAEREELGEEVSDSDEDSSSVAGSEPTLIDVRSRAKTLEQESHKQQAATTAGEDKSGGVRRPNGREEMPQLAQAGSLGSSGRGKQRRSMKKYSYPYQAGGSDGEATRDTDGGEDGSTPWTDAAIAEAGDDESKTVRQGDTWELDDT